MKTIFVQIRKGRQRQNKHAFLLAVELLKQQHSVGVVDIDPQQSLMGKMRQRGGILASHRISRTLKKSIAKGEAAGRLSDC